uniref:Peroxisomal biogenesis factor 3 n=1 Tax=Aceria tosichella TaxID=561515 RepID=A0A6G1SDY0_9ACAR
MGLFDFMNRHRNKILLVGGAAGTVLVINKILAKYEKQWESSSSRGFVHEARKKEIHFENIISECNQLCQRMSPKIAARLQELLDDSKLIESLVSKRTQDKNIQDKVEIWKSLKVKILTRLLSEIYCTCILVCYMRVQMSVIGGQVFAKNVLDNNSGSSSAAVADLAHMKAYTKYYAFLGSFYDQRFDCLIQPIEAAVEETLRGYSIDYKISIQDFRVILDKIKRSMSFHLSSPTSKTRVFFLDAEKLSTIDLSSVCPDSGPLTSEEEEMLRLMLAETQDILESEDFKHVLESSIEVGYAILLDNLLGAFIKMESKLNGKTETTTNFSNPNSIQVPLVKLLPQIRNNYLQRNESDQRTLVNHLLCLDVLNCFAANVYEAFCMPK